MKVEDVIKWCDKKAAEGSSVALCWEGGGDSGWVYMNVDEIQNSDEEAEWLIDKMYSELDYGSWAGEFSASGIAHYNSKTKTFEGEDIYSETQINSIELSDDDIIKIKIPKKYFFNEIRVEFENILDGGSIIIAPIVKNGILNQELVKYCEDLQDEVVEKAIKLFNQNPDSADSENSGWQVESWTMEELNDISPESLDDSEFYLCKICSLDYEGYNEDIRRIDIDLHEYAKQLNDLTEL